MNEEEYLEDGQEIALESDLDVAASKLISDDDEKKSKKWYTAPPGVRCYDKYRDTMKPYGFPRGGDNFISAEEASRMRASATYTKQVNLL